MSFIKFSKEEIIGIRIGYIGTPVPGPNSFSGLTGGAYGSLMSPGFGTPPSYIEWREWNGNLRVNTSDINKYYEGNEGAVIQMRGDARGSEEFCFSLSMEEIDARIAKAHLDPEMLSTALQYALVALDRAQERN